ncbi:hypothetical protein RB195_014369 [Necator americanus]|uniref:Reverse transcriptase domain-containing protein n=1 Tax=Necator americanus TaxID=51031 RepID=A0ABR1DZQ6_NECAM
MAKDSHTLQTGTVVQHIVKAHNLKGQQPEGSMESLATTIRIVTLNCRILSSELQQSAPSRLLRYPCVPFAALRETCMRDWAVISIENYTIYCGDADGNKVGGCVKNDYNNLIVIAHAPTETAEDNKKDAFYDELNALMSKIPTQKVFLVGFNANAKMGLEQQFDVIGKWYYPAERTSDNGDHLVELCKQTGLIIVCTLKRNHRRHQLTWQGKKWGCQLQEDSDNKWTAGAKEFEKVWEDMNPRKSYALLKQYSGNMKRCSPVLNIANGVAVGKATLSTWRDHFKTLLNRQVPSAPDLEHIHMRNYRGISLLRVIYKVLERIILDRLVTRDEQAGFRRGRYTIDQVFIVRRVIEIWQRYSKPMQLAFLDFEATFDSPRRGRLLNALRADGVQGKFVRLLDDMNQRTTAAVRTPAGCTTPFEVVTGVRQEDWQDPSCLISPSTIYDYAKNSRSAFCWCRSSTIKIVAKLAAACGL